MKADSYFEIGSTHQVCQDYALASASDDIAYAIVSDGCTSSKDTDIGSRLLTIAARDALNYLILRQKSQPGVDKKLFMNNFVITLKELVIKKCIEIRASLNVNVNAFDATLLIALVYPGYRPLLVGWGDGNFIVKYKNVVVRTMSISYDLNMPYYLSYRMSYEKDQLYRQVQSGEYHIDDNIQTKGLLRSSYIPWENNFIRYLDDVGDTVGLSNSIWEVSQIVVSSDGLQSFQFDPKSDEFMTEDKVFGLARVYPDIINYKNPVGEFVVRRMKSLEKENRSKHIIHTDDVSCATLILD